jgi:hypothetical protein
MNIETSGTKHRIYKYEESIDHKADARLMNSNSSSNSASCPGSSRKNCGFDQWTTVPIEQIRQFKNSSNPLPAIESQDEFSLKMHIDLLGRILSKSNNSNSSSFASQSQN